ncbi:hypothetical protein BO85DRAFT_513320 [Aspergillus piperis CBS 112811]|uniref:Uncharacterized protein n=1 Tax=Aspergillus piperis CBS 112811 TaxID=1448313 RepID=A0A8G1R357_9EURO|nr:hypothetical protein BO85DRAFT_513320 [Aspergillus piperis CBS 112811]RAH57796.1 hypothetical protein BO85DRAFT_513320 [Aspergillus piperis CBS 112811]
MAAPPASNFFYHTRPGKQNSRSPPRRFRPNGPKQSPPSIRTNNTPSSNAPQHQRQPNLHYKSNSGISKPAPRKPHRDVDGDIPMTDVFVKPQPQKRQPPPTKAQPNTGRKANNINNRKSIDGDTIMLDAFPMSQNLRRQLNNTNTPPQYRRGTPIKTAPQRPFSKDLDGDTPMFDILDMAPTPVNLPVLQPIQLPCYPITNLPVDFDGDSMMLEAF